MAKKGIKKRTKISKSPMNFFKRLGKLPTVFYLLIIAFLGIIFLYQLLDPSKMLKASDQTIAGYMFQNFMREEILSGHGFPLWNPYIFGGLPYIDAFHGNLFYPTAFLRLIFSVHFALSLTFIIQIIVAGIGMFLFLKKLKVRNFISIIGGVSYMFTGYIISMVSAGHDGKVIVASLLPWSFLFIHSAIENKRFTWSFWALNGLVIGLALLSPHVQMTYYLLMAGFFYFIYKAFLDEKQKFTLGLKKAIGYVVSVITGFLLSAVQFLPSFFYLRFSPREALKRGWEWATSWSMPPLETFDLLTPDFSGRGELYWSFNYFKQHTEYFGIIILFLAIFTVAAFIKKRRIIFFLSLGLFGILMAWGGFSPFYYIPYHIFPMIAKFRAPGMIFFITSFSFVILAMLGLEYFIKLSEQPGKERAKALKLFYNTSIVFTSVIALFILMTTVFREAFVSMIKSFTNGYITAHYGAQAALGRMQAFTENLPTLAHGLFIAIVFVLATAVIVYFLYKTDRKHYLYPVLMVIVLADLWGVGKYYVKMQDGPKITYSKDIVAQYLSSDKGLYRVFPMYYRNDDYLMLFDIRNLGGYHGNQLGAYQEFIGAKGTIMFQGYENLFYKNFLSLMNTKYIVAPILPDTSVIRDERTKQIVVMLSNFLKNNARPEITGQRYAIYRFNNYLPIAFLIGNYKRVKNKDELFNTLKNDAFSPIDTALGYVSLHEHIAPSKGSVKVLSYMPNRILLKVSSKTKQILFLSENYYKYISVSIDGKKHRLLNLFHTLRGVVVPEGEHTVKFYYDSVWQRLGLWLTIIALLAIILIITMDYLKLKREQ